MKKTLENTAIFCKAIILLTLLTVLLLQSCESFVEVDLPKSQLNSPAVFEEYATANAATTDLYSKMRDSGFLTGSNSGLSSQLGNYTDEMVPYGLPSNTSFNFYYNSILPTSPDMLEYWNSTYNQIYSANAVLEGLSKSTALTQEQMKQLTGEALFVRALSHFYLVNIYGAIPYIVATDYTQNSAVARTSIEEVYKLLTKDLETAGELLTENYNNGLRVRVNKYVVRALLARVYLYSGSYAEASNEASALLNQTDSFQLEANLDQVFLIDSHETIFQLQSATAGQNTAEGLHFIFESGPPPSVALNDNLVNAFSTADKRKQSWIRSVTDGNSTWFHPYKYKQQEFTPSSVEYSVIFRLAEQYLIRAEARAQQGDLIGAKEDLNKIRNRAGLTNTTAIDEEDILQAILTERRLELFSEFGHRFFDLKRFGKLDMQLSAIKPSWKTTNALFPIPQNELNANPNLRPQNPGY
ncbi:RagB/SusD family nutrient uptake outer membrane protein [Flavobacterium sp. TMP13]|uniref:RagB/SusD family nutrient uptake outer membrane protein n=1 Tax=Flavobacterium sp. TMP13 TaxID=3425950 RepID=UPI003D76C389